MMVDFAIEDAEAGPKYLKSSTPSEMWWFTLMVFIYEFVVCFQAFVCILLFYAFIYFCIYLYKSLTSLHSVDQKQ